MIDWQKYLEWQIVNDYCPNVCAKHRWEGYGECPRCEGIRVGKEIADEFAGALVQGDHDA